MDSIDFLLFFVCLAISMPAFIWFDFSDKDGPGKYYTPVVAVLTVLFLGLHSSGAIRHGA